MNDIYRHYHHLPYRPSGFAKYSELPEHLRSASAYNRSVSPVPRRFRPPPHLPRGLGSTRALAKITVPIWCISNRIFLTFQTSHPIQTHGRSS